jgi:hypothetical protein
LNIIEKSKTLKKKKIYQENYPQAPVGGPATTPEEQVALCFFFFSTIHYGPQQLALLVAFPIALFAFNDFL